jgi:hypothetical protein
VLATGLLGTNGTQTNTSTSVVINTTRILVGTNSSQINASVLITIAPIVLSVSSNRQVNSATANSLAPTILTAAISRGTATSTINVSASTVQYNNLRILYNDIVSLATVSASTLANFSTANLAKDNKAIWRSSLATSASITLSWASSTNTSCVIIPNSNITKNATIRIRGYTNIGDTVAVLDTGNVAVVLGNLPSMGISPSVNTYSYGTSNTICSWFNTVSIKQMVIDIVDSTSLVGYIELSRVMSGVYWSPAYNTEFGVSVGVSDTTVHNRTQAGSIYTINGTTNKTLDVPLNWLTSFDKDSILKLLKNNGFNKSIFISIFPNNKDADLEQMYQIYGKISTQATLTNPMYSVYASNLVVEEV